MAILNPCCCITLRTGAKIVSIVDFISAAIFLIIFLSSLIYSVSENGYSAITEASNFQAGVWTILVVFLITSFGICALLFSGATSYKIKFCKWWFYIQTVVTSGLILTLILVICFQVPITLIILDLIYLLYRFYTLWIVYLFIGELTYLDTICNISNGRKSNHLSYPSSITIAPSHQFPCEDNSFYQRSAKDYNSSDDGLPVVGIDGITNPSFMS